MQPRYILRVRPSSCTKVVRWSWRIARKMKKMIIDLLIIILIMAFGDF